MKLYRTMKTDVDGKPMVGKRRNMLGVRPTIPNSKDPRRKFDVDAVTGSDPVLPGKKQGLSVSTSLGRLFVDEGEAIWEIESSDLLPNLIPIADRAPHHVLEPTRHMTLDEYQAAIADTRDLWVRIP